MLGIGQLKRRSWLIRPTQLWAGVALALLVAAVALIIVIGGARPGVVAAAAALVALGAPYPALLLLAVRRARAERRGPAEPAY